MAVRIVNNTRCGFSGSVGSTVFRAGVQDGPLDTPPRSTTNLAAPAHRIPIGLESLVTGLALSGGSDVLALCFGSASFV